jgi:outer membrane receptor protein involved in Fe transport
MCRSWWCSILLVLGMFVVPALSQIDTGTIAGTVTDESGAVVPNVEVTIRNEATGSGTVRRSNEIGQYVSPPLPPGRYTITAESQGFRRTIATITLEVGLRAIVNLGLQLGTAAESVEVVAEAPLLQSETTNLNTSVTNQQIRDLPVNGRFFASFLALVPGVSPVYGAGIRGQGHIQNMFNGVGFRANRWKIDGLDNTENHNGQAIIGNAPIESIQEINVQTSVAQAEFGGGGANVNVVMRSGTRDLHGSLFHYHRNSALDARNFFARPNQTPRLLRNQFGGTVGGPVRIGRYNATRDKTFFFVSYEGLRERNASPVLSTVPTAAFKRGDFSGAPTVIYNPASARNTPQGVVRDPFPNNRIPEEMIDPVGRNIINTYPDPNLPGLANNYTRTPRSTNTVNNVDVKINHIFGQAGNSFVRVTRQNFTRISEGDMPAPAQGPSPAGGPHRAFVFGHIQTFTPNLVNETRAGIARLDLNDEQKNRGENVNDQLGIPGVNRGDDPQYSGMSRIRPTGYSEIGGSGFSPSHRISENWQVANNLSWFRGAHSFKFGFEVIGRRYNLFQTTAARGDYAVSGVFTQNLLSPAGTGNAAADLLLGVPISADYAPIEDFRNYRRPEYSFYAQDNWKLTKSLTLNYGLRYDAFVGFPWVEEKDRQANFLPNLGKVVVVNTPELPERSGSSTDWNNFGPRIGLAYKATNTTAIRLAYGIFYSSESTPQTNLPGANPPFVGSVGLANDRADFAGASRFGDGLPIPGRSGEYSTIGARLFSVDQHYRIPYAQQWNVSVQNQLPKQIITTLAYVGTKSTHNMLEANLNQPRPGPGAIAPRRPFPNYQDINRTEGAGSSIYHSLQVTADRRMAAGLAFQSSYTWSKGINDGEFVAGRQNFNDLAAERGRGSFDVTHRFTNSATWDIPVGRGRALLTNAPRIIEGLLGGWNINSITTIHTGLPFTVNSGTNTLNIGSGTQRADRLRDGRLPGSERTLQRYFDVSAFAVPAQFMFGNSSRNILDGPGTLQFDASIAKRFPLGKDEVRFLQFRAEFFNVANTPQFNNPGSTINTPTAGVISSAGSPETFQRTQRQIQLGLRLSF